MPKAKPKVPKVVMAWSKKEGDWIIKWPDREGKTLSGPFFDMTKTTGHRIDWGEPLLKILEDRGYDATTFQISVQKKASDMPKKEGGQ